MAGMIIGFGSGDYADVLSLMAGGMPSRESRALLLEFVGYLRSIEVIGEDLQGLTKIVDQAYLCYSNLVSTLKKSLKQIFLLSSYVRNARHF